MLGGNCKTDLLPQIARKSSTKDCLFKKSKLQISPFLFFFPDYFANLGAFSSNSSVVLDSLNCFCNFRLVPVFCIVASLLHCLYWFCLSCLTTSILRRKSHIPTERNGKGRKNMENE